MVGIPPIKMMITYVFGLLWYCYTNITNINGINQLVYPLISQYYPIWSNIFQYYPLSIQYYPLLSTIIDHYQPLFTIKHNWCRISQPSTGFLQHPWRNPRLRRLGRGLGRGFPIFRRWRRSPRRGGTGPGKWMVGNMSCRRTMEKMGFSEVSEVKEYGFLWFSGCPHHQCLKNADFLSLPLCSLMDPNTLKIRLAPSRWYIISPQYSRC